MPISPSFPFPTITLIRAPDLSTQNRTFDCSSAQPSAKQRLQCLTLFQIGEAYPHHCVSMSVISLKELWHPVVTPPSFAVRRTSKAQRFHPRTARPSPSRQDHRRSSL